jgi:Pyrimidine dimer DNA glycosylase
LRLWSIHPKYLDTKGLVACWRESLLAKGVLSNKTKGYKFHPQLYRFRSHPNPLGAINQYLIELYKESLNRGYSFDKRKIGRARTNLKINVTAGQIDYEKLHLKRKLWKRDRKKFNQLKEINVLELHPLFKIIPGEVEFWESKH